MPDADGRPEGFVVVSRDLTEHNRASQEMARRLAQQKALSTIGAIALSEVNFRSALQQIVELLSQAVDCPLAKVLQFGDNADRLDLKAGVGWHEGLVGNASVGIERASQAGYTLQAGGPVVVEDLRSETRFDGPQLLIDHGVVSGMSVTIRRLVGAALRRARRAQPDAKDLRDGRRRLPLLGRQCHRRALAPGGGVRAAHAAAAGKWRTAPATCCSLPTRCSCRRCAIRPTSRMPSRPSGSGWPPWRAPT